MRAPQVLDHHTVESGKIADLLQSNAMMSTYTLQHLIERLSNATLAPSARAPINIAAILREAVTQSDWLPPHRRTANHQNYARHMLHADAQGRFSILSIVWSPGQMSPVHGHHTWCAVGVIRGEIEETFYDAPVANGAPVSRRALTRGAGSITASAAGDGIHRIANRGSEVAISIHIYGVGADKVSSGINRVYS